MNSCFWCHVFLNLRCWFIQMSIPTKALQHIISIEWGSITISKLAKTDQSLAKEKKKKKRGQCVISCIKMSTDSQVNTFSQQSCDTHPQENVLLKGCLGQEPPKLIWIASLVLGDGPQINEHMKDTWVIAGRKLSLKWKAFCTDCP